jgi:O-antigen/teichoic acid export membrane protein
MKNNINRNLGKDVLAYIPVKLIPAVTGLLSIIILTRNISPEAYGKYSVVVASVLLFVQLTSGWLANSILYYYPGYKTNLEKNSFKYQILKLQFYIALPTMILVFFAIFKITQRVNLALLGAILLFGQSFFGILMTFYQSAGAIRVQAVVVGAQSLSQLLMLTALIFLTKQNETFAVVALVFGYYFGIFILLFKEKKEEYEIQKKLSKKILFDTLSYGVPMCLWFFATQLYTIGDRLFLQYYGFNDQLGQYAAFRDLVTGCAGFLTMPLVMASHPIIMEMWRNQTDRIIIEELINKNIVILLSLFSPILIIAYFVGPIFINALFGNKYSLDAILMLLVVISTLLGSITIYLHKGLEVTGKTLVMSLVALTLAVFSGTGNIYIIPLYGVNGSAILLIIVQLLYMTTIWFLTKSILRTSLEKKLIFTLFLWLFLVSLTLIAAENLILYYDAMESFLIVNLCIIFFATILLYLKVKEMRIIIFYFWCYIKNLRK